MIASGALLVAFVIVLWLLLNDAESEPVRSTDEQAGSSAKIETGTENTVAISAAEDEEPGDEEVDSVLTPEETILNVNCRMLSGKGSAEDVAVVTLLSDESARFAVLDANGTLFGDMLPFRPHHFRIGRRPDGSVLVGFANLRLNSGKFRPPESDEPVRIYHDGHIVYETKKAKDFDIAHDGSSYFVWEPSPGRATRLIVRNMEDGTQKDIELGTGFSSYNAFSPGSHSPGYSHDSLEIMLTPAHEEAMGRGVYWFYPVGLGPLRTFSIEGVWGAVLTSSENGYLIDQPNEFTWGETGDGWKISRRKIDPSTGNSEALWSRTLKDDHLSSFIRLSQNGKWMGVSGREFTVFDTETGEIVFTYPEVAYRATLFDRLKPVLPENATIADVGDFRGIYFVNNALVTHRSRGNTDPCNTKPGEQYDNTKWRECVKELRMQGRYRTYYDVFELDNIELDSSPSYRTEVYRESNCMPTQTDWRGLLNLDGELAYRPQIRIED